MNALNLLKKVVADLNGQDADQAAAGFDYPFFALADEATLIVSSREQMIGVLQEAFGSTERLSLRNIEKEPVSHEPIGTGLTLIKCKTRLISEDGNWSTDPRTEYVVVRETKDGPRLAASLNLFGGHINLRPYSIVTTTTSRATSPQDLVSQFADAIRQSDMALLGQTLSFPSIAISGNQTRVTPDFDQYLSFASQLADFAVKSGLSMSVVMAGEPKAVGNDLLLAPISLHMTHASHGDLPPYDQLLCLRIGTDSISCVVVINAIDGPLAQVSEQSIK